MKRPVRKFVAAALFGVASMVTASGASAAIVTGNWDPVLPAPFINLGWVATVNLQIANNCVLGGPGAYSVNVFGNSFGCINQPVEGNFDILRAQVGLYSTVSGAIVDVLTFAPPAGPMGVELTAVVGATNAFLLTLGESNVVQSSAAAALGLGFKFEVPGELPELSYQDTANPGTFITASGVPMLMSFDVQPDSQLQNVLNNTVLTVGQVVGEPAAIPEPGSLALALLALGAAGAAASRRTRPARHVA